MDSLPDYEPIVNKEREKLLLFPAMYFEAKDTCIAIRRSLLARAHGTQTKSSFGSLKQTWEGCEAVQGATEKSSGRARRRELPA